MLSCKNSSDNPVTPDPQPSVSVADQSAVEGDTFLFAVTIDRVSSNPVVFAYNTVGGTAAAGTDFTAVSATDTIASGQTLATILVSTIDDAEVESAESFLFVLISVSGAQVNRGSATGTITDNDISDVSFDTQVKPLLQGSCAKLSSCHASTIPGGDMYIDTAVTYSVVTNATGTLTGRKVVVPDSASESSLYFVTTSTPRAPFSRMPTVFGLDSLTTIEQHLLRDWIDQGAQDN
jgi:hypothetical protein